MKEPSPPGSAKPVDKFFSGARSVYRGEADTTGLDANDIVKIAADPAACAEFERTFRAGNRDPEFESLVRGLLEQVAENLKRAADKSEIDAQTIDKIGVPFALSTTGVGIAAIIATGGAAIPIAVAGAGLFCLATTGFGGWKIRHNMLDHKSAENKVRNLIERIKDRTPP